MIERRFRAVWGVGLGAVVAVVLCGPGTGVAAFSQPPPGSGAVQQDVAPADLQELFDSYVLMQAQRQLQLTNEQLPQFILRLKALQTVRRRAENQRRRMIQELRRLTQNADDGRIDEAQVRERLKTLDDLRDRSAVEIKQALADVDQVLDLRQQARFRVLEQQVEGNKIELMMRARQQANRPLNPRRP